MKEGLPEKKEEVVDDKSSGNKIPKAVLYAGLVTGGLLANQQEIKAQTYPSPNTQEIKTNKIDKEITSEIGSERMIDTLGFKFNIKTIGTNIGNGSGGKHRSEEIRYNNQLIPITHTHGIGGVFPMKLASLRMEQHGEVKILMIESISQFTGEKENLRYLYMPGEGGQEGKFVPFKY